MSQCPVCKSLVPANVIHACQPASPPPTQGWTREVNELNDAEKGAIMLEALDGHDAAEFLRRLAKSHEGRSIVSTASLEPMLIEIARKTGHLLVLSDGLGFVLWPAQPASPPPTQGWEEALRFLEAEAFQFEEDHEPPAWCGHCGHPYRDEPDFKHEPYCPVAKRLATLRSHLSGRETPQGWTREKPKTEGWYWIACEGTVYLRQIALRWEDGVQRLAVFNEHLEDFEGFLDGSGDLFMPAAVPPAPTSERSEA